MPNIQILIVEDEEIIAKDIKNTLEKLEYTVSAVVSSGEEAVLKASETVPDLVLMDIVLKGDMDGIEAAKQIHDCFGIPVVYLTACSDDNTLQRAKISEPYGYILKPLGTRELHIGIEIALYKHRMEKRLRENERWLAAIVRCLGDGMIVTDAKGVITFMNPIAEALTDWKHEDVLGKNLIDVFSLTESPVKDVLGECNVTNLENYTTLTTRDGTSLPVENNITPIRDDKGETIGAVMAFRDITRRKEIDGNLLQSEKFESLRMMVSGITHEFKNILAIIQSNIQLLKTSHGEHKELASRLGIIGKMVFNGNEIIRRMKEFINVKQDTSYFIPVCMKDLAEQVIHSLMPRWDNVASAKGVTYRVNRKSLKKIPAVLGNPSELKEVIINIINNAFEAMPDGGCLTVRTWGKDDSVFIGISDAGEGMSEDVQKRLFDPFFTTRTPGRIGLGMSVAYGVMTRHGGKIDVKSEMGKGCTITLIFPIAVKKTTRSRKTQIIQPKRSINTNKKGGFN